MKQNKHRLPAILIQIPGFWESKAIAGFSQASAFPIRPLRTFFSRIRHVERMHMPDPCPDNHVETRFEADGTGTLMTMRMTVPDRATREAMLATGMEHGMEASYARLDAMAP